MRNGDQGQHSFSLPLAGGNFFPDFVAKLDDGRVFVVEHKGAHLVNDPGEREKDVVGRHWASRRGGKCRSVMVPQTKGGLSLAKELPPRSNDLRRLGAFFGVLFKPYTKIVFVHRMVMGLL